ncbi:amino acid ABC transporter permease [Actinomadura parmotrematis]|uniref:Amino acid ABC transporter permease n=1 Tax=Actinomadura parmotrematis TaxID=2864039 RepID=A0ABS7FMI4_9ACTN|nr:amino acid ABC transporter permease [Actinomadura parmotrematis]MBW8480792.1 amino acid ABC transporter permease [Actinomadura parmotrematis]
MAALRTAPPAGAPRLSRRRRRGLVRGGQYAAFVVAVVVLALLADWHSIQQNFLNPATARGLFPDMITVGLFNTLVYALSGSALGLAAGLVLALMRLSSAAPYRWFATAYIEVFRGLPALLIFIFVAVGVPLAYPGRELPGGVYGQAAVALGLVSAAFMAEIIRAGIEAVPRGQTEAARSLGMSHARALRTIVVPQALRMVIPPLTNELVSRIKDSSLALFIGVTLTERELSKFGQDLANQKSNSTPIVVAGVCYLAITIPLGYLARRLEDRQRKERR